MSLKSVISPKAIVLKTGMLKTGSLKTGLLAALVTAGLAVGVDAAARGPDGFGRDGMSEILAAVPLSDAQKQQIQAIHRAARAQNVSVMAQLRTLQQQMAQTMFSSGAVTEAQLLPLVQQQESLRQQLDVSRMQTAIAIRNLLTSAQLAQATAAQAQLAALHQQERTITAPSGGQ